VSGYSRVTGATDAAGTRADDSDEVVVETARTADTDAAGVAVLAAPVPGTTRSRETTPAAGARTARTAPMASNCWQTVT
jgi:hypothetical protein